MEVITINKEDFSIKCIELSSKLDKEPQLIVGILNGGGYVTREIQNHFKSSHFEMVKQQRQNRLKSKKVIRFILKLLPYKVLNWLRVLESKKVKKSIS